MNEGILHRFTQLAAADPDAPFLAVDGEQLSRGQFLSGVSRCASALRRFGIGESDVVVLCSPNRLEWCIAFWATVAIGAVPAPLDPATGVWEMRQLLPILRPRLCLATTSFRGGSPADRLREAMPQTAVISLEDDSESRSWKRFLDDLPEAALPLRDVSATDLLLFACTSGTTGNPKILAVPHLGFAKSQDDMASYLEFGPHDRVLLGMPLFHQGGFGMGLQALLSGAQARYVQAFDPSAFLSQLSTSRSTVAQLSPTLAKLVLTVPGFGDADLSAWRMAYFAGEVLPDDLARHFCRNLSVRTINVVGSSETGTMLVWDSAVDEERSASDLATLSFTRARIESPEGRPLPAGEPGILTVSTDALLSRYEANPSLTTSCLKVEDGLRWYSTGDLAVELPDGRFRFLGRARRVVKRGPNLVHPEEVEAFLLTHPAIAGVAVGKKPHEVFGESLVAWIQAAPGKTLGRMDVVNFCRDQISSYKIPDRLHFVDRLPTDVGKIQHIRLREASPTA